MKVTPFGLVLLVAASSASLALAADCNMNGIPDDTEIGRPKFMESPASTSGRVERAIDIDGDGDFDVATLDEDAKSVHVWRNDATGKLVSVISLAVPAGTSRLLVADLVRDGDQDLLAFGTEVVELINEGNGTAWTSKALVLPPRSDIAIADIDGDGDADLVLAMQDHISFYLNEGGNFTAGFDVPVTFLVHLFSADVDHDGDIDFAFVRYSAFGILRNDGSPHFVEMETAFVSPAGIQDVVLADLDGDGFLDAAAQIVNGGVEVYRNNGDDTFTSTQMFDTAPTSCPLTVADVDGDGDPDLVPSFDLFQTGPWVLPNQGNGRFGGKRFLDPDTAFGCATSVDLNADGKPDLVGNGYILLNQTTPATSSDCDLDGIPDECQPAGPDCNHDGIRDSCQLFGDDCNADGVLDSCDFHDCNHDGRADVCDPDTDGDSVPDECDLCLFGDDTIDDDNDGVPTCADNCPLVPNPDQVDADQDGAGDSCDGCLLDYFKTQPGQCGCNVSDKDSDRDGTSDCVDACPFDAAKVAPGICGCGVPESEAADSDGDGTADCFDLCPDGDDRIDGDGDGIPDCIDRCPMWPSAPGARVYVASPFSVSISVIDTDRQMVESVFTAERVPADVKIAPDGHSVYVVDSGFFGAPSAVTFVPPPSRLLRFDVPSHTMTGVLDLIGFAYELALSLDGTTAFVATAFHGPGPRNAVEFVDLESFEMVALVDVPFSIVGLGVSPDSGRVYVGSFPGGSAVIDVRKREVIENEPGASIGYAFSRQTPLAFISTLGRIVVTDTVSGDALGSITIDGFSLALARDEQRLYAVEFATGVAAIDVPTRQVVKRLPLPPTPDGPYAIAITERHAYITDDPFGLFPGSVFPVPLGGPSRGSRSPGRVNVVDLRDLSLVKTIRTGVGTAGIDITRPLAADPNCSGNTTAADLPSLYHLLASGQRSPCRRDDVNDDCAVEEKDVNLLLPAIFSP